MTIADLQGLSLRQAETQAVVITLRDELAVNAIGTK
jgi:hypothetical protein